MFGCLGVFCFADFEVFGSRSTAGGQFLPSPVIDAYNAVTGAAEGQPKPPNHWTADGQLLPSPVCYADHVHAGAAEGQPKPLYHWTADGQLLPSPMVCVN